MSSHNSRLAADSYKNCVWTISGEAPEFRAPVSCGVPLRSCKAPDQISGAARTSQTLGDRGPSRGKVDEQARGSRPCVGIPVAPGVRLLRSRPGVPRVARAGSLRRPRSGEPPVSGLGNPDSPLPAPSLGSPGSLGIRKTGARGGVAFPNPGSWLREKVSLKLNIQKMKIMSSSPITSWQIDEKTMETVTDFYFPGLQNHCRW